MFRMRPPGAARRRAPRVLITTGGYWKNLNKRGTRNYRGTALLGARNNRRARSGFVGVPVIIDAPFLQKNMEGEG